MRLRLAALGVVFAATLLSGAPAAMGDVPSTASNMGYCSSYLAQLDIPGQGNIRAEVNHVIKEFGPFLGLASPGDLYKVRAHQHVNQPPAQECTPRQLPGGGSG